MHDNGRWAFQHLMTYKTYHWDEDISVQEAERLVMEGKAGDHLLSVEHETFIDVHSEDEG